MDRYEIVATAAVIAMPLAVLGLLAGARRWARDALDRQPRFAVVGILATCAASGNLLVERRLGATVTRPILALFLERAEAFRAALLSLALTLLLVAATSVAVRLPGVRR